MVRGGAQAGAAHGSGLNAAPRHHVPRSPHRRCDRGRTRAERCYTHGLHPECPADGRWPDCGTDRHQRSRIGDRRRRGRRAPGRIGAGSIAHAYRASHAFIGLIIVAIGTSVLELATTAVATLRNDHDVAIGNLIGSSHNILIILA
nr:hypothetical protein [Neoroseomonas lacus]